ncbi:MAG: thioredoxin-dependent thiol peroxidase [Chitinophagaceae bacterium]
MITLKEGDKAPDFTGIDQDEKKVKLSSFKGKKVILYFYPKDLTSTCTVQACNLRDNYTLLTKKGYVVIGVSPDDVKSHQKFIEKNQLPFILIADTEQTILNAYGVWGEKSMYGRKYMGVHRTTFVIDEKGRIERVILKPKSSEHAKEILKGA